jgi:adenosine kinase
VKIVISGSIGFDYLMTFPGRFREHLLPNQLDRLSVSFLVDTMVRRRGGNGPNIAEYRTWLEAHGIDTSAVVEVPEVFTASFFVSTDLDNNQIASFYTGAMAYSHRLSIAEYTNGEADLVVISPDDPRTMRKRAEECKALDIPYVYDPSQQIVRLTPEELVAGIEGCFLLIVNDYEFGLIQKKTGWGEAEVLARAGGLIITLGERGSHLRVGGEEHFIPVVPPERIADPTGTGDAFRGGLLRGYSLGLPWDLAGRMGSLAATYVMEQLGGQGQHYTPAQFVARFRRHFNDRGALEALL